MENKDERIEIETKEIDLPKIDLTKYVGKKAIISDAGTYKGQYGYYAKFETAVLETLKEMKEPVEVKASVIFGLQVDKNDVVGWGKETKLGKFLAKYGCKTINDMVGKEVLIQIKNGKEGAEFLTIV